MKNKLKKLGKISIMVFVLGTTINMGFKNNKNQQVTANTANESVEETLQANVTTEGEKESKKSNKQKDEKDSNENNEKAKATKEKNTEDKKEKSDTDVKEPQPQKSQEPEPKIERPKNSIRINGEDYPIRVGAQDEINEMNREFINTGCYFARRDGTGGIEYKINGDGMSIYLAIESEGYGHVIWNTKKFDFTDINGNTESYHFVGTGCYQQYDYGIFEEQEYKETIYAGYAGDMIAIQTCDPDSNGTGKARAYYFVKDEKNDNARQHKKNFTHSVS